MPNRWPITNGNWSSAATWSGSLIPTASDDVFANNFTVNVDTSINVLSLRNTSTTGVTAGGTFNFNSGSISASLTSATGIVPAATNLITVTAGSGDVTISAPTTTITGLNVSTTQIINHTGDCNLIVTASSLNAGNIGSLSTSYVINKSSNGALSILGNVNASTLNSRASFCHVLNVTGVGSVIVQGNVTGLGGADSFSNVTYAINQVAGTLTINGNITGGVGFGSLGNTVFFNGAVLTVNGIVGGSTVVGGVGAGIQTTSNIVINISGSVIGRNSTAILANSACILNITGSITVVGTTSAVTLTGASTLTYSGSLTSANNVPAIISSNASATNIFTGPFINTNDTMAVQCADMVLTQDASTFWNFGDITLYSPEQLAYYPSASDIRQGTTYADGTVSGSLAMPPPTAVIAGTPTDNTTGSAVLTPAQLQDAVWGRDLSQMTETGSIGYRLAKSATTDSTGNQIASYLI